MGPRPEIDPLSGATVWIAGGRQARPIVAPGRAGCPFCVGGIEAPEPYEVRAFPNRWAPLPDARAEIVLYSPDHDTSLAGLGAPGVRRVVDLWAERTASLGARSDVAYVLVFENRGPEVGATVAHPHGQLFALPEIPDEARRELDRDGCGVCRARSGGHLVTGAGGWQAVVPSASRWPYELLVVPTAHHPDLPAIDAAGRDDLAATLADALGRLDRVLGVPMPYMLWVHQRPSDGTAWPGAHLHIHVVGHLRAPGTARYVAAGELGSGVWFNPIEPAEAAAALRRA